MLKSTKTISANTTTTTTTTTTTITAPHHWESIGKLPHGNSHIRSIILRAWKWAWLIKIKNPYVDALKHVNEWTDLPCTLFQINRFSYDSEK
jgi:hypothetical protein